MVLIWDDDLDDWRPARVPVWCGVLWWLYACAVWAGAGLLVAWAVW